MSNDSTQRRQAEWVIGAIIDMIEAHHAVSHEGASRECFDERRKQAVSLLASALASSRHIFAEP